MASVFSARVEGAAPLLAQLETSTSYVVVTGLDACGANALGSTSRPILYRPATPGLWDGFHPIAPTKVSGVTPSNSSFVTVFSAPPSTPSLPTSSVKVPFQILLRLPVEQGIVILDSTSRENAAVLYANTAGGHAWNATLIWEEM